MNPINEKNYGSPLWAGADIPQHAYKPATKPAHTPTKAKVIRLRYEPTGETIKWRIWREPKMFNTVTRASKPSWLWSDSDGYVRCGPETWAQFVPYLRAYFASYNATPLQDFS